MARPQTEEGFVMVALELFPAILSTGLGNYEFIVLAEALVQLYGPAKRKVALLSPVELQDRIGIDHHNARRALKALVSYGILQPADESGIQYKFIKDYESWTPKSGRLADRMGGRMVAYFRSLPSRFVVQAGTKSSPNGKHSSGSGQTPKGNGLGSDQTLSTDVVGSGQTPATPAPGSGQTPNHVEEAPARLKDRKNEYRKTEEARSAPGSDPETDSDLADRITRDVFKRTEPDGSPDEFVAGMLRHYIAGLSERAVMAGAYKAMVQAKSDPVRFFAGMCQRGLEEPPAAPEPGPGNQAATVPFSRSAARRAAMLAEWDDPKPETGGRS